MGAPKKVYRTLHILFGDQLSLDSPIFDKLDPSIDAVWMAEVHEEATHVWSHKARIALFFSAMRHFRDRLREEKIPVVYTTYGGERETASFRQLLGKDIDHYGVTELLAVEPGDFRVETDLREIAETHGCRLTLLPDNHFYCSREEFSRYAESRSALRMEYFYREMRKKHGVLMHDGKPEGGSWNFDADNRKAFGKAGPTNIPAPPAFAPDDITQDVIQLVDRAFHDHPGDLSLFNWPVTRADALHALDDFIHHRLPRFGDVQDAMWTDEPFLFHSLLSPCLNLKLINPREVVEAAEAAYREDPDTYPLNAVEGFIRQVLGWREYVRGIYWRYMPEYIERNELKATAELPDFYWTGDTDMHCMNQALAQTLTYGYAHHIQRLMVTGLFGLLFGINPRKLHEWYLAVYVDAVEWVELPNTLGMSQFGDGGIMASKPYVATGKYIDRMSNYCKDCRFDPNSRKGDDACPFTVLYWDFLMRHETRLTGNQRMRLQMRNLERLNDNEKASVRMNAERIRNTYG